MNAPDRTTRRVRDWLRESTPTPPDAERSVDEVMTTLFRQTQLRPRLSFLLLAGRGGREGGSSMFSALKLGVVTALVALFGGLLAVGISQPDAGQPPGAAASAQPSAASAQPSTEVEVPEGPAKAVTGRIIPVSFADAGESVTRSTAPEAIVTGYVWEFRSTTNDSRLDGAFEFTQNIYQFLADDLRSGTVHSGVGRITNDGGSWAARFDGFAQPGKNAFDNTTFALQLSGEGGYDGLSAMLIMSPVPGSHWNVEGILFPGAFPEPPTAVDPPRD